MRGATGDGDVMVIADCEAETRESRGLPPTSTRSPQLSRDTTTRATGNKLTYLTTYLLLQTRMKGNTL